MILPLSVKLIFICVRQFYIILFSLKMKKMAIMTVLPYNFTKPSVEPVLQNFPRRGPSALISDVGSQLIMGQHGSFDGKLLKLDHLIKFVTSFVHV